MPEAPEMLRTQESPRLRSRDLEDTEQLIDDIGVSKRLGNSVLSELDHRATNLLANLTTSTLSAASTLTDPELCDEAAHKGVSRFETVHGELIESMDSIDTHYAVKRNRHGLNVPATPKRYSIQDAMSSVSAARETDRAELLYHKRARDAMGNIVERLTTSPVTDITRRIRRLRMNMSTPREHHREQERQRRRSSIIRQSLTGNSDKENHVPRSKGFANLYGEMRAVSSSAISVAAHESGAPTFAKPTITSRQKTVNTLLRNPHDATSFFASFRRRSPISSSPTPSFQHRQPSPIPTPRQQLSVPDRASPARTSPTVASVPTSSKFRPLLTLNSQNISTTSSSTSPDCEAHKPRVVASKSVFDRLYHQPTTAAQQKTLGIRKSKTQGDLHYISKPPKSSYASSGSAATSGSDATLDDSSDATMDSTQESKLPRSKSIADLKVPKVRHPMPLHRSSTGSEISMTSSGASVASRRPLWR
ncbi:AER185Cp [Eremothecium gossypii ATCC 10895]|uniref:AER185Cp n=1 Tax=Eremothecium gossypii (strain ATCC 10895 / CBS 109.51 / FGSC 9923 / NRRL Y-1056) TaxID=284811 RepID=Q756R9_EREGS|nr:AER185Cp [Eremothecium gossypii ATCC 10895]AAS52866.2 AER185Cp [Eremothecium gossypii ATCC 10895]AEY97173.1 FAER185Cp [Eremothecium gossypii FDAG1]